MNERESWFWLTNIQGIYGNNIKEILSIFESPLELFEANINETEEKLRIPKDKAEMLVASKNEDFSGKLKKLEDKGIRFICMADEEYPENFFVLQDLPYSIYVKGNLPNPDIPCVGMVGARACTGYGRKYANYFAEKVAMEGIQTVSGMAVGIDSECAKGTIKGGGKTFAVLGGGVDVIYPRENIELYYEIIASGGGIISEFPPGTPSKPWQFPYRNRLISALSDKLMVIEAGFRSGTLSTAMHSLNLGKDVYALPGRLTDKQSEGCNRLIYDGAGMLLNIDDFIYDLKIETGWLKEKNYDTFNELSDSSSNKSCSDHGKNNEKEISERIKIILSIEEEPKAVQSIADETGLALGKVKIILSELEMDGLVNRISGDYYEKAR